MTERQKTDPPRFTRAAAIDPGRRKAGTAGPSPLIGRCLECGRNLPKRITATFAICVGCSARRPGAVLGGRGGLAFSFGRATGFGRLRYPEDGAYGMSDGDAA